MKFFFLYLFLCPLRSVIFKNILFKPFIFRKNKRTLISKKKKKILPNVLPLIPFPLKSFKKCLPQHPPFSSAHMESSKTILSSRGQGSLEAPLPTCPICVGTKKFSFVEFMFCLVLFWGYGVRRNQQNPSRSDKTCLVIGLQYIFGFFFCGTNQIVAHRFSSPRI